MAILFVSWEVGGYNFPEPSQEEFIQSVKIGALLPTLTIGGRNGSLTAKAPWVYGDEFLNNFKYFIDHHYKLIPFYLSLFNLKGKSFVSNNYNSLILNQMVFVVLPEILNNLKISYDFNAKNHDEYFNWIHSFTGTDLKTFFFSNQNESLQFLSLQTVYFPTIIRMKHQIS